jgi:hypothetical protein
VGNRQEFRVPTVPKIAVACALLLVVAVAVVLITPDTTDDINAVAHRCKVVSVHALDSAFGLNLGLVVRPGADLLSISASIMPLPLLERLCTYRC